MPHVLCTRMATGLVLAPVSPSWSHIFPRYVKRGSSYWLYTSVGTLTCVHLGCFHMFPIMKRMGIPDAHA